MTDDDAKRELLKHEFVRCLLVTYQQVDAAYEEDRFKHACLTRLVEAAYAASHLTLKPAKTD